MNFKDYKMIQSQVSKILILIFLIIGFCYSENIIISSVNNLSAQDQDLVANLSPKDLLAVINYYGCRVWDTNGYCIQCSQGYYFNPKKICCIITPNCANFNITSGQCEQCQSGYELLNSTCSVIKQKNQNESLMDLGCANWDWNNKICISCSFRWILTLNKTCVPVSDFCKTYNSSGACTSCFTGYVLELGACISIQSNLTQIANINCIQWDSINLKCLLCSQGMKINGDGVCIYNIQNCLTYNINGSCNDCSKGYSLNNFSCTLIPTYKKIIPNVDPEALCIDGSPAALYFQQGTIKDKFFLYFIGGGFVGGQTINATLDLAYQTSKSILGSSLYWPEDISILTGGYLNDNQVYNGWNKVIFTYCDGAFHQGYSKQPIMYGNQSLYFRGSVITRSHFKWLIDNYNLDKASKIMLSGGSSGAVSVFQWSHYLTSLVQTPNSIYFVPDSGAFLNVNVPVINISLVQITLSNFFSIANKDQKTPLNQCNLAFPGQQWKCMILQYAYPFLSGKYLWINSQYDSYMIYNGLQITCLTGASSGDNTLSNCSAPQIQVIQQYRNNFVDFMNTKIKNQNNSAWLIGCSNHVYGYFDEFYDSTNETVPQFSQNTVKNVVKQFLIDDKYIWLQDDAWPANNGCAF